MARERRRLLIPPPRLAERIALNAGERHYLTRVLRLTVGQGCDVVDGAGRRWSALLAGDGGLELEQPLAAPLEAQPPPAPLLELAVALPRQDVEVIWRMATELGIDRFQPLLAERCLARERWPLERWRTILREASEQCERLWLPALAEPMAAAAWLAEPAPARPAPSHRAESPGQPAPAVWPGQSDSLAQWERSDPPDRSGLSKPAAPLLLSRGEPRGGLNLLATSRGATLPLLPQLLAATTAPAHHGTPVDTAGDAPPGPGSWRVRLAIGPEGGWSPAEEAIARSQGWIAVSAGPTILRTATAAVAAAAWLSGWRAALSSSSSLWRSP